MPDMIHHPQHYGGDTDYETIKVMIAWDAQMAYYFCVGNGIKYLSRLEKKDPEKRAEDLRKSSWYASKAAEIYELYLSEAADEFYGKMARRHTQDIRESLVQGDGIGMGN